MGITKQKRIDKGMYWDRAWSLVAGCEKISPGCLHCWSEAQTHIRSHQTNPKMKALYGGVTTDGKWNGNIKLLEQNLSLPYQVKKPTSCAIWNDLFHKDVPFKFQLKAFVTMMNCPQHFFFVPTKRAERMKEGIDIIYSHLKFRYQSTFPLPNVMLMVTAENQEMADKRTPHLLQTQAALKGLNVEPLLGGIDSDKYLEVGHCDNCGQLHRQCNGKNHYETNTYHTDAADSDPPIKCGIVRSEINQVIVGGESGPGARPMHPDWVRGIRDQCKAAGVKFFLKQMHIDGKLIKMPELDGKVWDQLPEMSK